ncbi:hypothetical protein ACFLUS_02380 [Chloroflexota bacterium]
MYRTITMTQTSRFRPLSGSHTIPRRQKSISATSPGAVSAIRTVVRLFLPQPLRAIKRRSEV